MSGKGPPEVVPEDPPGGDGETGSGKACGLVPWEPWEGAWGGGRDLAGAWQPGSSLLSLWPFPQKLAQGKLGSKADKQKRKKKETKEKRRNLLPNHPTGDGEGREGSRTSGSGSSPSPAIGEVGTRKLQGA